MQFISYLINGISLGSVYAIIALGYTMVYGIAKMLNFAHGDIIMVGSYVVYIAVSSLGLNPILSVVISAIACLVLGVVIEKVAYKPLRHASKLAVLITAIGVSYFLQNVALLIFGANTKSFTSVVPAVSLKLGSLTITAETIVTILACVIIMICLTLFINKTKAGHAMQAVSEDQDAAQLMGINVNATISLTFAIGSALAAVAGVLLCSAYPSLTPYTGADHRLHAWYQGLCSCRIRRYRLYSGCADRRYPSWCDRDPFQSLYFFAAVRCHCIRCPDRCSGCEADRYPW